MTDKFIMKVLRERIVDTKNYRYCVGERIEGNKYYQIIKRLPKEYLGTTASLDRENWEEVFCHE